MANEMNHSAYSEMYQIQENHWWYVGRRLILKKILSEFLPSEKGKILEIGSGAGGNIQLLSTFGSLEITDIEIQAINFCKEIAFKHKIDISFSHGDFYTNYSIKKNQSFSAICLFDVLEHLENEIETLDLCFKLLAENGKLLITVPAYQWLWSAHDEYLHHVRRYSKAQLIKLIENSGFRIVDSGYFNSILFPLAIFERLFNRNTLKKIHVPSKYLNLLLLKIFSLETHVFKHFSNKYGLSIWLTAVKIEN